MNAFSGTSIQTPINNYGSSVTGWNIQLNCVNTNNVRLSYGDATLVVTASNTISPGQWNHVAVTRSGTTVRIWINGVASATATSSTNISAGSTLTIARGATGGTQYFNGKLDDLRITKYARYQSSFTPPTQAHPNIYNPYTTLPVSGAALWLDGADSSTLFTDAGVTPVNVSGDLVYQWSDKSGNNRHATQATSGNRPTWLPPASGQNGFGVVGFNGTSQFINTTLAGQPTATIFVVAKKLATKLVSTSTTALLYDGIIDCDVPAQYGTGFGVNNAGSITTIYDNGFRASISTFSDTLAEVLCYQWNATNLRFLKNSTEMSTFTYVRGATTTANYVIGKSNANALYFGGYIHEIIIYQSFLSSNELAQTADYLKTKWGTP